MSQTEQPLHVVVGANGPLGSWIVRVLSERGDARIRAVSRSGGGEHGQAIETVAADASEVDSIIPATAGAAVIYHAVNTPYNTWPQTLEPIMAGMLAAAEAHGAKLVYGDNLYAYGDTGGEELREEMPWQATTDKGAIRARLLKMLFEAHEAGRIRATVGMASDFYGPRVLSSHLGEFMIPKLIAGKAGQFVGNPDLPHSYTHIHDFARDLVTLASNPRADGKTWHTTNAPARTTRQHVDVIADELGVAPKIMTMPRWLFTPIGWFDPIMREMKEMLYQFHQPFVVSDARFRSSFGAEATDLDHGLRETARWYREHESSE